MPREFPPSVRLILSIGVNLEPFGSANWGLHQVDALDAVSSLYKLGFPILGGDVWELKGNQPFLTYDNWFCQRSVDELSQNFLERSVEHAKRYIGGYSASPRGKHLFAIVIDRSRR